MTKAYSGKPGCACGCRGSWHDAPSAAATRVINKLKKAADAVEAIRGFDNEIVYSVEIGNRLYIVQTHTPIEGLATPQR